MYIGNVTGYSAVHSPSAVATGNVDQRLADAVETGSVSQSASAAQRMDTVSIRRSVQRNSFLAPQAAPDATDAVPASVEPDKALSAAAPRAVDPTVNANKVSSPWVEESTAVWSGTLTPDAALAGGTITVGGSGGTDVTFEFCNGTTATQTGAVAIDVTGKTAEEIAQSFTDSVNASAKTIWGQTDGDAQDICTWTKDDAGTWTLQLNQPEAWTERGDSFTVVTSSLNTTQAGSVNTSGKRVNLKITGDLNGQVIQIAGAQITVTVGAPPAGKPYGLVWDAGAEQKSGKIYVEDASQLYGNDGTLTKGLRDVLAQGGYDGYTVSVAQEGTDSRIVITESSAGSAGTTALPSLSLMDNAAKPNVTNTSSVTSTDEIPAYWEYELDLDTLKGGTGDNFVFRDVKFIFTDAQASSRDVAGKTAYINTTGSNREIADSLTSVFNRYFGPRASSSTTHGTPFANTRNALYGVYSLLKSGAFEMSILLDPNDSSKAILRITACTKEVLEDGEIKEENGEGWHSAEETEEAGTEGQAEAQAQSVEGPVSETDAAAQPAAISQQPEVQSASVSTQTAAARAAAAPQPASASPDAPEQVQKNGEDGAQLTDTGEAQEVLDSTREEIAQDPKSTEAQSANLENEEAAQLVSD